MTKAKPNRKLIKKVLRKIVDRGNMSFATARGFLKYKPNFVNIDKILNCWRISKYDKDFFGILKCYFIEIHGEVYIVEYQPYFTTSFTCPIETEKAGKFIRQRIVDSAAQLEPPLQTNYQARICDEGSRIWIKAVLHLERYFELYDESKHGELTKDR